MIDFCPDGYVPLHEAMFTAAKVWYPEQISELETAAAPVPESQTKSNNSLDAAVRAFSQWPIPAAWQDDAWRHAFANIWSETAHRLTRARLRSIILTIVVANTYRGSSGPPPRPTV
jgi:hypothetical protein